MSLCCVFILPALLAEITAKLPESACRQYRCGCVVFAPGVLHASKRLRLHRQQYNRLSRCYCISSRTVSGSGSSISSTTGRGSRSGSCSGRSWRRRSKRTVTIFVPVAVVVVVVVMVMGVVVPIVAMAVVGFAARNVCRRWPSQVRQAAGIRRSFRVCYQCWVPACFA